VEASVSSRLCYGTGSSAGVPGQAEQPARQGTAAPFTATAAPIWRGPQRQLQRPVTGTAAPICRGTGALEQVARLHLRRPIFPFFLPPSYTHRHRCEVARAPGGSCAGGRFPPRDFVWEILKVDCGHTNRSRATHADSYLCHAQDHASRE
jgi:hypothetical protein